MILSNNNVDSSIAQTEILQSEVSLLEMAGIFLFTKPITDESTAEAIRFILEAHLNDARQFNKIQLIMNSAGGDLQCALALSDIMQGSSIPIHTTGIGVIASAALVIFMSGLKGHRLITPNTMVMSHQWSAGTFGKEHELLSSFKGFELVKSRILAHYKKFTGLPVSKIERYLLPPNDVWISAEDAIKLNLADRIVSPKAQWSTLLNGR